LPPYKKKRPELEAIQRLARPDLWAENLQLRVDARPFSMEGREYVRQVIRDTSPEIVVKKAAQMAFTITFIVRTFHWMMERQWHHMYLLPLKTGAIPFVQSRIDPIIDSNQYVKQHFKSVDNRLHKQSSDNVKLLIRGTNIPNELQETPVDCEVWDERDRMIEENLEDARHRMDGSHVKRLTMLSTPTAPGHGVDSEDEWHSSDQHLWEIPCPGCNRFQVLNFEENVKIGSDAHDCTIECRFCRRPFKDYERMNLNSEGRWAAHNLAGHMRGYHISQFNSSTNPLYEIMKGWFKGQNDARQLRSFFNNSLGEPYVAAGDQLTPQILDKSRMPGHTTGGIPPGPVFIGVDIGDQIHLKASYLNRYQHRVAWTFRIFSEWEQVDKFFQTLTSFVAVIDAHPEKRAARDLCLRYPGQVFLGFEMDRPQTEMLAAWSNFKFGEAGKVVIDRTMAFDTVIDQYIHGRVHLPQDANEIGEHLPNRPYNGFYSQMIQMVRVEEEDTKGRIIARWKKNKNKDHWHHADMFELIATLKTPRLQIPAGIGEALKGAGNLVQA
jgi:hypothetical protein